MLPLGAEMWATHFSPFPSVCRIQLISALSSDIPAYVQVSLWESLQVVLPLVQTQWVSDCKHLEKKKKTDQKEAKHNPKYEYRKVQNCVIHLESLLAEWALYIELKSYWKVVCLCCLSGLSSLSHSISKAG